MKTLLMRALPIALLGCATVPSHRILLIEQSAPPPQCESLGEAQGRGPTLDEAKKEALKYADGLPAATHIRIDQVRDWDFFKATAYTPGGKIVIATVYRCPPGAKPTSK